MALSKLHQESGECLYNNMELFRLPATQEVIEETSYDKINPTISIGKGEHIEFKILTGDGYADPSSIILYLRQRITLEDGTAIKRGLQDAVTDEGAVAPVNYLLGAQIKNLEVFLNNQLVSESDNLYAYKSIFEVICNYCEEAKKEQLAGALYHPDSGGDAINTLTPAKVKDGTLKNKGFVTRFNIADESAHFECWGTLSSEFLNQSDLLIDGCELRIKIQRHAPAFCLHAHSDAKNYALHTDEAFLLVKRHKIAPSFKIATETKLQTSNILYNVRRVEMKYFSRGAGLSDFAVQNLSAGRLPRRIILGMVTSEAFHGSLKLTPYNFQLFSAYSIILRKDSVTIPFENIELFPGKNLCGQAYIAFLQGTNHLAHNRGCGMTPAMYSDGHQILPLDISGSMTDVGQLEPVRHAKLSLYIKLKNALTEATTLIVYLEYDDLIQMDKDRQVIYR